MDIYQQSNISVFNIFSIAAKIFYEYPLKRVNFFKKWKKLTIPQESVLGKQSD